MQKSSPTPKPFIVEQGLRWYTVQTKPRQERQVEKHLRDLNVETFLPWIRVRRRVGTRHRWVLEPLFPSYLFCRLDLVLAGKAARYSPGVKDFVRFGSQIPEISESAIGELKERCPDGVARVGAPPLKKGQPVIIREGPLSGLEAVFDRELAGKERIAVLLEFLGRQTRAVVPAEAVGRI
ncbi:MAG TPA: transcription termination/antitermination NusG family protein [Candidatus Acidoferrales bacterium]|nr:transcription termination/antitermination NusG family protein [Candidatus Acidoferrales bacterium]